MHLSYIGFMVLVLSNSIEVTVYLCDYIIMLYTNIFLHYDMNVYYIYIRMYIYIYIIYLIMMYLEMYIYRIHLNT